MILFCLTLLAIMGALQLIAKTSMTQHLRQSAKIKFRMDCTDTLSLLELLRSCDPVSYPHSPTFDKDKNNR